MSVGHQGDGRGVNCLHDLLEFGEVSHPPRRAGNPDAVSANGGASSRTKPPSCPRCGFLLAWASPLRLGGGAPEGCQASRVVTQAVAYILEPDGMGELGVEQSDYVALCREGTAHRFHPMQGGELPHQARREKLAKLGTYDRDMAGWFCFFHTDFLGRKSPEGQR